jgi:hypothetical protein
MRLEGWVGKNLRISRTEMLVQIRPIGFDPLE